jgi:YjbE family integral membrane protein
VELDAAFWLALVQIIGINIILSGDNAVVIALACRNLPPQQQKWGIIFGAGAAVVLRIIFTIFIVYLMTIPYLKFVGGLLLFWIGYKLLMPQDDHGQVDAGANLMAAVRIVLIADAVMSLDNVLAVAAAAKGSVALLIIGLVISVPLVVYGATLLITLINRWPVIIPGGAALIGYIGAEVMITDLAIEPWIEANAHWLHDWGPLLGAVGLVAVGRFVAPPPAPSAGTVAGEAAGAAAVAGAAVGLQLLARILVTRAPLIVASGASALGYNAGFDTSAGDPSAMVQTMFAIRPVFAAVIAVLVGEMVGWLARRMRGEPAASHSPSGH